MASGERIERFQRLLGRTVLLVLPVLCFGLNLRASSLDSTIIGMFPKDAGDFGYANLDEARKLPWYPQFAAQVVPVAFFGFDQFLQAVQIRQSSSISEVAWASVNAKPPSSETSRAPRVSHSGPPIAMAVGDFDIETIQSYLDSKKVPSIEIGNYILYSAGLGAGSNGIFFVLLDRRTIAFGALDPLKRVLRVRDGQEDSLLQNESMMSLIEGANGNGVFWGVVSSSGTGRAIDRLIPEAANFPQSRDLISKLKEMMITVRASDDVEVDFQAISDSPDDTVFISQLLQAGVLMRRYETKNENNPGLATLLDGLRILPSGNSLAISLRLTSDQVISLIEHNTFSMKM